MLTAGNEIFKNLQDSLTRSLHIIPYGPHPSDSSYLEHGYVPGGYLLRPGTAPPVLRNNKVC